MLFSNLVVLGLLDITTAQITPIPPITTSAFPTSETQFTTAVSDTSTGSETGSPIGGSIFTSGTGSDTVTLTLPLSPSFLSSDSLSSPSNETSTTNNTFSDTSTTHLATTATSPASVVPSATTSIPAPSATPPPASSAAWSSHGSISWSAAVGLFLATVLY